MTNFHGHCLCGSVRFSVRPPSIFCVHCHCHFCRAAHGAAFVTWVGVPEKQFSMEAGDDLVTWHSSSEQSRRGFCSQCGSTMFFASTLCPGEIHIARPYFDGEIDLKPVAHVFFDQHAQWFPLNDDLPKLDADHPMLEKYQAVEGPASSR